MTCEVCFSALSSPVFKHDNAGFYTTFVVKYKLNNINGESGDEMPLACVSTPSTCPCVSKNYELSNACKILEFPSVYLRNSYDKCYNTFQT